MRHGRPALFVSDAVAEVVSTSDLSSELERFGVEISHCPDALRLDTVVPAAGPALILQPSWHAGHWRLVEWDGGKDGRLPRLMAGPGRVLDPQTIHAAAASFPDDRPDLLAELVPPDGPPGAHSRDGFRRWLATDMLMNAAPPEPEALAALIADGAAAMTRAAPRISIIINNYNYAAYLADAIDSSLNQIDPADEVIVVDDGSTDGSAEVIARFPDIRAVFKENGGQASAFNAGFAEATGDLILFLDADDRLRPDAVARLRFAALDGVARLSFGLETIDASGHPTGLYPASRQAEGGVLTGLLMARGFLMMMPTSGNAFPRASLEALLPMPEAPWRISADVYLCFGASLLGETRHLHDVLGQYRVHGANAYHATLGAEAPYAARKLAQRRQAFGDLAARLDRPELEALSGEARTPATLSWHLHETDPAAFGGPATWPVLGPGAVLDLTEPLTEPPFGHGWRFLPGRGMALEADYGALALRLSGPRSDWTLRLLHRVTEVLQVEPWINGVAHDPMWLEGEGALTLSIDASLLELDPVTRSWRVGITLVRKGAAVPVFTAMGAQRALPNQAGAPVLHQGEPVSVGDSVGRRVLAEGWDWPGPDGAMMDKNEARLRFSHAGRDAVELRLDISPTPLSMAGIDGVPLALVPDGAGFQVTLPPGLVQPSGLVDLTVTADPNEAAPRLLRLCLGSGAWIWPPSELLPRATEASDWKNAEGAALWLAVETATLGIPQPLGAGAVEVTVLALAGQKLRLRVGAAVVESSGAEGPERLRLPLEPDMETRLTVETTALQEKEGMGPLGGAILGLFFMDELITP